MPAVARGRLAFERSGERTVVRAAYAESPLRLLTPNNHGSAAWAYTSTLGGGFVDGDRVRLDISVADGARAFVSTQGPTRVYRSPRGCDSAISAAVAPGGTLVLAPDPTACFAGARFRQRTDLDLAEGASVALWEVLSAGRTARGERWALSRCSVALAVRRNGQTVLDECWLLDPAHGALGERLGRFDALGTALLCGPAFSTLRDRIEADIGQTGVGGGASVIESASAVGDGGLLVRMAAVSVERLVERLRSRFDGLALWLEDDPFSRRL